MKFLRFLLNHLERKPKGRLESWGCRKCGGGGPVRGTGQMHDPNEPWYKFWKTITCDNCLGYGNNTDPRLPADPIERRKCLKQAVKNGTSDFYTARNGKKYRWQPLDPSMRPPKFP